MPNLRIALTLSPVYLQWNILKDSFHEMFSGINALKAFVRTTSLIFVCSLPTLPSFQGWLHSLAVSTWWRCEHTYPFSVAFFQDVTLVAVLHFHVSYPFSLCAWVYIFQNSSLGLSATQLRALLSIPERDIAQLSGGCRLWKR